MKLIEALRIVRQHSSDESQPLTVSLACGFTPLHLETFLRAQLCLHWPARNVQLSTGLYGDLAGTLERLENGAVDACAIAVEWSDLDPRLGIRSLGGWSPAKLADIVSTVRERVDRLSAAIERLSSDTTIALSLPTLPLPPVAFTPAWQAGEFEWHLREALRGLTAHAARIRILNPQKLDALSPMRDRLDVTSELHNGFPYSKSHASIVAEMLAHALYPPVPKKGLITDLDGTLWKGIVGEVGSAEVAWDLNGKAQIHGLYQQCLASLMDAGVLVAIASRNDPAVVSGALARPDMVVPGDRFFPVEVSWNRKSASVARILEAWNISADAVVFVDDSQLELAEVARAFPEITPLLFSSQNLSTAWALIERLRDLFGKDAVSDEDALRLESLRQASVLRTTAAADGRSFGDLLRDVDAVISVESRKEPPSKRAFELVNKTNQFNMNGIRVSWGEWCARLREGNVFQWLVSYSDKYGPLGGIAALLGRREGNTVSLDSWVMSCRAFARNIEHMTLRQLFDLPGVDEIVLATATTPRNGPFREFLAAYAAWPDEGPARITRAAFEAACPALYLRIEDAKLARRA